MRILRQLLLASLCLVASALHESEVGIVDWHTKLIGVPLLDSAHTQPTIHDDLVLTATSNNVLAALNVTDGSIVWRSIHQEEDNIFGFKVHDSTVSTLSGPGGSMLRIYDLYSGSLMLEKRLHSPSDGRARDRNDGGVLLVPVPSAGGDINPTGEDGHRTLLVLTNGDTLRRLDALSGSVQWTWESPDQGSLIRYTHVHPLRSTIYLVGYARIAGHDSPSPSYTSNAYTLHVTTLDLGTGELIASVNIPARVGGLGNYMLLNSAASTSSNSTTQDPCLAWLGSSPSSPTSTSTLYVAPLSPKLEGQVLHVPGVKYARIMDVGLAESGQFVAVKEENGAVQAMRYVDGSVRSIWEFGDAAPSATHSESHFVGTRNAQGEPTIGRIYWSAVHGKVIHQTFVPQFALDKGSVSGYALPFATVDHGAVRHVACSMDSGSGKTRVLLTTSTGSLQLWVNDQLRWMREEGLAGVGIIGVVDVSGSSLIEGEKGVDIGEMEDDGFWEKVRRQFGDLKDFPAYALNFATRFVTGSYSVTLPPSPSSIPSNSLNGTMHYPPLSASLSSLSRKDTFTYNNNILILPTSPTPGAPSTKLFAIDSSSGAVLWSRVLGLGWAVEVGGHIVPVKIFQRNAASSRTGDLSGEKEVVLVTQRRADNGLVDTVVFHVDPLTGEDVSWRYYDVDAENETRDGTRDSDRGPLEGVDVIQGPLIDAYILPDEDGTLVLLDEFLQVYPYPSTPSAEASLAALALSIHLALRAGRAGQAQILGHQLGKSEDLSKHWVAYPTWRVSFAAGEEIQAIVKREQGPVASIGKVLGDRRTLYKYLNPHLSVVLTSHALGSSRRCGVYLLDNVKGTVLYHVSLPAPEGGRGQCEVKAALDENWLVYSYFHDGGDEGVGESSEKGYRVVSVEIYEGSGPDDKIRSSDMTSYSPDAMAFTIYELAYIMPHSITAIAPTRTKFGVSVKDMIVASRKNSIQTIPRRLLNPRRPKRKPTSEELEEMLIQYDAVLPDDPKLVLSHLYEVASITHLTTFPSRLESTSLIFASGLDLFLTRVATSGTFDVLSEGFNKMQLVLTVAGLAVGIGVTRPMVRKKRLRERWY
ncbi:hypothetical protein F5I97DRAFT_2067794 [Phlebopus sp. FC_14]|nr:hypothetical protein F5I97DRAFT_2067794 [Phlebopus sp. FC_14]